jgi:hypothetical protein
VNERIQELARQAAAIEGWGPEVWQTTFSEKFAELLSQEAIKVVQKRYMGDNNREDMEVLRCVQDLEKYFGVQ